jgi:hypothetical protein
MSTMIWNYPTTEESAVGPAQTALVTGTTGDGKTCLRDAVLDEMLAATMGGVLAKLEARLDVERGLADVYARVQSGQEE